MWEGARRPHGRRTLLVAGLVSLGAVAGCGIRLEDDAPSLPLVPTREPVPAEDALVALTRGCDRLAVLASQAPGALAAALATVHRRQHTVLRTTLVREQVPPDRLDATATTGPSTTPTGPTDLLATLAVTEAADAAGAASFTGVSPDLRGPVAALHAQRYAAADLLTGRAPSVPTTPVDGDAVAAFVPLTAAAVYFLEVVAARSEGAGRRRAQTTLGRLRGLHAEQAAGAPDVEVALGHPLPYPVRTPAEASRLAHDALTDLRTGYGPLLDPLVTGLGGAGWSAATRWQGTVEAEAHRWGVALQPFPGLT
jgi:hypothetical protein